LTDLTRRSLVAGLVTTALLTGRSARAASESRADIVVVGGGTAGLPLAIVAADRGLRVTIVEAAGAVGGTLFLSGGMMAAAGTRVQRQKGIEDTPARHYADVMRLSGGTADPAILRLAVREAGPAVDWLLDAGLVVPDRFPISGPPYHDPYGIPRYVAPKGGGRGILDVLNRLLKPHTASGRVELRTGLSATRLVVEGDAGRVIGIEAVDSAGRAHPLLGSSTVLTTGGYTANPDLVRVLDGRPDYALGTYPYSRGDAVALARAAGGFVRGADKRIPGVGAILASHRYPSPVVAWSRWWPADRPPWEIQVNAAGRRFFAEDSPSFDAQEKALAKQPGERAWIVFDAAILERSPALVTGPDGTPWSRDELRAAFERERPMFYRATRWDELAARAGIDAAGLAGTVRNYNASVAERSDPLGRRHLPAPLSSPPFFAIETHGTLYVSAGGIAVDDRLRVIQRGGKFVPGLYAAGEVLGAGQLMGRSISGGMTVTPSIALGRYLGMTLQPTVS
jgi:fumarate reductase flavoprotein subunit